MQRAAEGKVLLRYSDDGVGLPEGFHIETSKSLGMRLIYNLSKQLGGEVHLSDQPGFLFELWFSMEPDETGPSIAQLPAVENNKE